jgi:hypothetical protein
MEVTIANDILATSCARFITCKEAAAKLACWADAAATAAS